MKIEYFNGLQVVQKHFPDFVPDPELPTAYQNTYIDQLEYQIFMEENKARLLLYGPTSNPKLFEFLNIPCNNPAIQPLLHQRHVFEMLSKSYQNKTFDVLIEERGLPTYYED